MSWAIKEGSLLTKNIFLRQAKLLDCCVHSDGKLKQLRRPFWLSWSKQKSKDKALVQGRSL